MSRLTSLIAGLVPVAAIAVGLDFVGPMRIPPAAAQQACHEGPRLYETDHNAYVRQSRRVFAAWGVPYADRSNYELDHRIPRCLGGSDADDNLWPQPLAEAKLKDRLERKACRIVCRDNTMSVDEAVRLFDDWRASYRLMFGVQPMEKDSKT